MQSTDKALVPSLRQSQIISKGGSSRRHENIRSEQKFTRESDSSSDSDSEYESKHRRPQRKSEKKKQEPKRDPSCEPRRRSSESRLLVVECCKKCGSKQCRCKRSSSSECCKKCGSKQCRCKRSSSRERCKKCNYQVCICHTRRSHSRHERKCDPDTSYGLLTWASGVYSVNTDGDPIVPIFTSTVPILLGDGEYVFENVDANYQSTDPVQVGGYSKPIPFDGRIKNLEVSMDIFVSTLDSDSNLNNLGEQYDFTILVSRSPPNNGTDHPTYPYLTIPLVTSLRFGLAAGNPNVTTPSFRAASNINLSSYQVYAGDRVGIRVQANPAYDAAAVDISRLSFQVSLAYERLDKC